MIEIVALAGEVIVFILWLCALLKQRGGKIKDLQNQVAVEKEISSVLGEMHDSVPH